MASQSEPALPPEPEKGAQRPGFGRSRGGLTSKLHRAVDGLGRPLGLVLTGGNVNDCTRFTAVMGAIRVPRSGPGRPRTRRLLLDRQRHPLGRQPSQEGRQQHLGRAPVDPRGPPGRRPDLRHPRQPVRPQGRDDPALGEEEPRRALLPPTYASWANPIEAHFGPLRQFTVANSNHRNHTVQTRALHACLRWRNTNARHPDVLAAQRKERARIRSEKGTRWGGRPLKTAA
ncbi:hypothetical protein GCM10010359_49780 [Streptomyces morookaense]|nr:hypothetical protein GCM10010359_49780 [Streptomyces morookaense]